MQVCTKLHKFAHKNFKKFSGVIPPDLQCEREVTAQCIRVWGTAPPLAFFLATGMYHIWIGYPWYGYPYSRQPCITYPSFLLLSRWLPQRFLDPFPLHLWKSRLYRVYIKLVSAACRRIVSCILPRLAVVCGLRCRPLIHVPSRAPRRTVDAALL